VLRGPNERCSEKKGSRVYGETSGRLVELGHSEHVYSKRRRETESRAEVKSCSREFAFYGMHTSPVRSKLAWFPCEHDLRNGFSRIPAVSSRHDEERVEWD
jgi:hypothetical protein